MQANGALDELLERDPRYPAEAYAFVMEALSHTVNRVGERRHVTGRELLGGVRELALDSWGLMARHVLRSWGITRTDDFGEIVFNLVGAGLLSKTEEDRKQDFHAVYGFVEAFDKSYSLDLDEHGQARRKLPPVQLGTWTPFLDDNGLN